MKKIKESQGFTLIEILLVVVIMGIMLAVIVPRAWRANIDTKYGLIRQNCNELASFGRAWAEEMIIAQDETSPAVIEDYLDTLINAWLPDDNLNWRGTIQDVANRTPNPPEAVVEDLVPPEKQPRNPFNGASVFALANDPFGQGHVVPGAIAAFKTNDTSGPQLEGLRNGVFFHYGSHYAFLYAGTDSTLAPGNYFHAGQNSFNPGSGDDDDNTDDDDYDL